MGIKRIDFGKDVEVSKGGKVKALQTSPKEGWLAEVLEVKYKTSKSSDNVGIELVWKVTDEEAVDIEDNSFTGKKQWDTVWFSEKSLKMTKLKLAGLLGDEEVDNLIIEDESDVQELAVRLREEVVGAEFAIVTEAEEDNYGSGTYDDGSQKYRSNLKFVNAVS